MAFAQELHRPARGLNRLLHRIRIIGLAAKNAPWRIGDDERGDGHIGLVGRSRLDAADDAGILAGRNMGDWESESRATHDCMQRKHLRTGLETFW